MCVVNLAGEVVGGLRVKSGLVLYCTVPNSYTSAFSTFLSLVPASKSWQVAAIRDTPVDGIINTFT